MMRIPLPLLPDTMTVYERDYSTDYDGEYKEPYTIEHVRFERAEALSVKDYQLSDGAKGRIWIDGFHSKGARKVPMGAKVVIDGDTLHVKTCSTYKVGNRVHHWELDVI